jgi:hypothetical protein
LEAATARHSLLCQSTQAWSNLGMLQGLQVHLAAVSWVEGIGGRVALCERLVGELRRALGRLVGGVLAGRPAAALLNLQYIGNNTRSTVNRAAGRLKLSTLCEN